MLVAVVAVRVLRWLTCWKVAVIRFHVGDCGCSVSHDGDCVCTESVEMVDLLEGRCRMM